MARTSKRIPAGERRKRIVEATLRLVADGGIQGATTARIAAAVDMSEGTLYRLFGSKTGILVAALDTVYDHFFQMMASCRQEDPIERLRELGAIHTRSVVSSKNDHYISPLFEFISAPTALGLHDAVAERQQRVLDALAGVVEEGKAAGTIPAAVDSQQVAWTLLSVFWTEDLSTLIGLPGFVLEGRSRKMIDVVLRCFGCCTACLGTADGVAGPGTRPLTMGDRPGTTASLIPES
ncbi:MAG: TetR/AcrR family transcriptional regulator [bacterium]